MQKFVQVFLILFTLKALLPEYSEPNERNAKGSSTLNNKFSFKLTRRNLLKTKKLSKFGRRASLRWICRMASRTPTLPSSFYCGALNGTQSYLLKRNGPKFAGFFCQSYDLLLAVQVEISAAKLLLSQQTSGKRINVTSHENGRCLPRNRMHKRESKRTRRWIISIWSNPTKVHQLRQYFFCSPNVFHP